MKILKVAIGNKAEAHIEDSFIDGINIIESDENNKGKTIVIQSILYAMGNKPIFPTSFNYKDYFYYVEFEHGDVVYSIIRAGDSYVLRAPDGLRLFDGMSELKRYWTSNIFSLPCIPFNGENRIVDMELFVQIFFVGQDGKNTSTIFNSGYYHKDDFKNMILSFAKDYSADISPDEVKKLRKKIKDCQKRRQEQIALCDFYKTDSPATEYLSRIKDQDAFSKRVSDMDAITDKMSIIRKRRNLLASKRALWNSTLKELRSLNRDIKVGELRCMDCDSTNIAFKGKGKATYSFDVSTPEIRNQIIESIQEKIGAISEEISVCDYDIEQLQSELNALLNDEDITIENIVAFKSGFSSAKEIEDAIAKIEQDISQLKNELKDGLSEVGDAKQKRDEFFNDLLKSMNEVRTEIDPESDTEYEDIFTKRGSVVSGSEETVFYVSKIIAIVRAIKHQCPIIIDSFRAEDLSSDKEDRILSIFNGLSNQCILTTTLKNEEKGKYNKRENINVIDYTAHQSNKVLGEKDVNCFAELLQTMGIEL